MPVNLPPAGRTSAIFACCAWMYGGAQEGWRWVKRMEMERRGERRRRETYRTRAASSGVKLTSLPAVSPAATSTSCEATSRWCGLARSSPMLRFSNELLDSCWTSMAETEARVGAGECGEGTERCEGSEGGLVTQRSVTVVARQSRHAGTGGSKDGEEQQEEETEDGTGFGEAGLRALGGEWRYKRTDEHGIGRAMAAPVSVSGRLDLPLSASRGSGSGSPAGVRHSQTRSEMRSEPCPRASITGACRSLQMLPKPRQALLTSISPVHFGPPHPALSTPSCANACVRS